MSNPTKVIKYGTSCILEVVSADNRLEGFFNPDAKGIGGSVFLWHGRATGAGPGASIDLTAMLKDAGGKGNLAIVGSNFQGGGAFEFTVKSGIPGQSQTVKEKLGEWTSKQWAFRIT